MRLFEDYIYEVRGCNDPIDGDIVKFDNKAEALWYADTCPGATVYMVSVEEDPNTGCLYPTGEEVQIRGPEVDQVLQDPTVEDSCAGDSIKFSKADLVADPIEESLTEEVVPSNTATELISAIKTAVVDFQTLHRNLSGGNWFTIHDLLGDWYEELSKLEDKVVENLLSLGYTDGAIGSTMAPENFTEDTALHFVQDTLLKIKELSMKLREEVQLPTSVAPVFDELEQFCQIEGEYKLGHYFSEASEPAETEAPVELENAEEDDMSDEEFIEAFGAALKAKKEKLTEAEEITDEGYDDRRGHDPVNRKERVETLEEAATEEEINVDGTVRGVDPTHDEWLDSLTDK